MRRVQVGFRQQWASEVHFRVRTQVAGPNGTRGYLQTRGLDLDSQLTHLVGVYARGADELYVDGVLFTGRVTGDGLTVIAQMLGFDATSRWQQRLLVLLLLGPVALLVWVMGPRDTMEGRRSPHGF
jgi:hypothetical protein